jgi:hypothetical protein
MPKSVRAQQRKKMLLRTLPDIERILNQLFHEEKYEKQQHKSP